MRPSISERNPLGSWWVNRMSLAFGCEDADPAVVHGDGFDERKHAVARRAPERNPGSAGRRSLPAWRAAWIWQHVVDDIIWHVGGTTPLSGTYRGMDEVLDFMKREREAMVAVNAEMEMGDVLANDDHVVLLGTMSADLPDGRRTGRSTSRCSTSRTRRCIRSGRSRCRGWLSSERLIPRRGSKKASPAGDAQTPSEQGLPAQSGTSDDPSA